MKTRLDNMVRLRSAVDDYTGALKKQQERLQLSRWLRDQVDVGKQSCPICGGAFDNAEDEAEKAMRLISEYRGIARHMEPVPAGVRPRTNSGRTTSTTK